MYINNDIDYIKWLKGNDKKVIIYGAAATGRTVFHKLKKLGIQVKVFIDKGAERGNICSGGGVC
jgi:UDP-N-acetylmuramoylalanine-D-glutamate ligase